MKNRKLLGGMSCLLAAIMLALAACGAGGGVAETSPATDPATNAATETLPEKTEAPTEAPTEGVATREETETPSETEEPEPLLEAEIPQTTPPFIGELLLGERELLDEAITFINANPGDVKTDKRLVSTGGTLFKKSSKGLTTVNTGWDALGFAAPLSTDTYVAEAEFAVAENDRGGDFNAAMAGLFCVNAENLFIDGGLWFSFRENQVAIYVKGGFSLVLKDGLPFDAAEGICFKVEGDDRQVKVSANELHLATVDISETGISVKDPEGTEVAATDLTHLAVDGSGYFRYMTHYANATLKSLRLTGETIRDYAPSEKCFSFLTGQSYGFADKEQNLIPCTAMTLADTLFVEGETLGKMLGFSCTREGDTLTLIRDNATLVFEGGAAQVTVNGEKHPFPTVIKAEENLLLAATWLGEMLGYKKMTQEGLTLLAAESNLTEEAVAMAQDRFDLYESIIYNYDDVECDQRGVGIYPETPCEERMVGIAYTTWHRAATKWGTGTWDLPLYGTYCSDDESMIRKHGELLRDAGVDFVFVDWSNNTGYVPETMRELRADFRMIEEATDKLFDVWATIEGAPKICIFVGPGHNGPGTISNGQHQKKVDQVWRDYVTNPARADMYFHYDGKPLLMCYGATPTQYTSQPSNMWDDDRYTVRWVTGYVGQQSSLFRSSVLQSNRYWSWEERGAQTFTVHKKKVEAVTVSAATRAQGSEGDSGYIPAAGRENGATFKKQVQRACDLGARLMLIVSWNEWSKGEQPSPEVSKDIEPSVIYGTFYYDLMREQIKKFKGQVSAEKE